MTLAIFDAAAEAEVVTVTMPLFSPMLPWPPLGALRGGHGSRIRELPAMVVSKNADAFDKEEKGGFDGVRASRSVLVFVQLP